MSPNSSLDAREPTASSASESTASPNGAAKPASDSSDRLALCHRVLTVVHDATQPAELPPAWGVLRLTSQLRQLRCPAAELAELLRARFSVEQLLEVGVFERAGGEVPSLNAKFGTPAAKLRFKTRDNRFYDVYSAHGALLDADMPAVRYARTLRAEGNYNPKSILLAANDDDVNLLSSLGRYCRWAAGLDTLCGPDLRRMFQRDNLGNLRLTYRFILVGWQPAALDRRPAPLIVKILERFCRRRSSTIFRSSRY